MHNDLIALFSSTFVGHFFSFCLHLCSVVALFNTPATSDCLHFSNEFLWRTIFLYGKYVTNTAEIKYEHSTKNEQNPNSYTHFIKQRWQNNDSTSHFAYIIFFCIHSSLRLYVRYELYIYVAHEYVIYKLSQPIRVDSIGGCYIKCRNPASLSKSTITRHGDFFLKVTISFYWIELANWSRKRSWILFQPVYWAIRLKLELKRYSWHRLQQYFNWLIVNDSSRKYFICPV